MVEVSYNDEDIRQYLAAVDVDVDASDLGAEMAAMEDTYWEVLRNRDEVRVCLPPGYCFFPTRPGVDLPARVRDAVRMVFVAPGSRATISYILDKYNPEYEAFVEKCGKDTQSLRAALTRECEARGLNYWTDRKRRKGADREKIRVDFIICPPMGASFEEKTPDKRKQGRNHAIEIALHFDAEHNLQFVRDWNSNSRLLKKWTDLIEQAIAFEKEFFKENYGNWDVLAKRLMEIVEEGEGLARHIVGAT